jgi:hypothetical protein
MTGFAGEVDDKLVHTDEDELLPSARCSEDRAGYQVNLVPRCFSWDASHEKQPFTR